MDGSTPDPTHPPSRQQAAVCSSGASSKATHAPSAKLWNQVRVHRTLRPLLGPPWSRSLRSTSLPYPGYVGGPAGRAGPACMVSGCLRAAQLSRWLLWTIWHGYAIQFTRRPPKFRGIHLTAVKAADAHVLRGNRCPTGEGHDETGPYSLYEVRLFQPLHHCAQEKRWVTTNPRVCAAWTGLFINFLSRCLCRSASSDSSVPEIGLQRSTWRTRTSMCRSFPQASGNISVQGPALQAVPIAPCLHESSGGSPCSLERTGCAHSQLLQQLAHTGSGSGSVMRTQGFGAFAPQPVGPLGQLGKEQTLPDAEDRFSLFCLTQERAQSVLNCLNTFKSRMAAPLKQFQRLLGHMAAAVTPLGLLHMRPLQHWLHGRVPRWA